MFEKIKIKKTIKQLKKNVEYGDVQSMYDLAMIYLNNNAIKNDKNKAFELLQLAADKGHLQAKTYLLSNKLSKGAVIGAKAISDIANIFINK